MKSTRFCSYIALVCAALTMTFLVGTVLSDRACAEDLDVEHTQPFRLHSPVKHQVDFRVSVTPPGGTKVLRVWLPLPRNSVVQKIDQRVITTFPRSVEPEIHREPKFGNQFAYFEFKNPDGAQLITHQFVATIHAANWNVDYAKVAPRENWPETFGAFRQLDPRTKENRQLRDVVTEITRASKSSTDQLLNAMNWVDQNLTYDHAMASLSADPLHGLTHRRGHCSDYHGLCSTLAQTAGYPSRVLYGLQMFDKGSPSHCKLEVYLPPYGWIPYDLSETQKLVLGVAKDSSLSKSQQDQMIQRIRSRTMNGFRENTWLYVTRGTNFELAPRSANGTVPIVRTIYAEADGIRLPEPDPSSEDQTTFAWMTMHRVDSGDGAKRFKQLD